MTHNIIKTENYLLIVSDEIPTTWYYDTYLNQVRHTGGAEYGESSISKKVIGHLPLNNSPVLEGVPLLPPLEDEAESLSLKSVNKRGYTTDDYQDGFEDGYNKAKEKYKYTEEDIDKAYSAGMQFIGEDKGSYKEFIQSLQQPKMPAKRPVGFECEIFEAKDLKSVDEDWRKLGKHKTTTNSQGQTVLVGKYIY